MTTADVSNRPLELVRRTVQLPADCDAALAALVVELGTTRSHMMRQALALLFAQHGVEVDAGADLPIRRPTTGLQAPKRFSPALWLADRWSPNAERLLEQAHQLGADRSLAGVSRSDSGAGGGGHTAAQAGWLGNSQQAGELFAELLVTLVQYLVGIVDRTGAAKVTYLMMREHVGADWWHVWQLLEQAELGEFRQLYRGASSDSVVLRLV